MTNYFDPNIDVFRESADFIRRHCTRFAGHNVTAPLSAWPFMVFCKNFSRCEDAVTAINFECTAQAGGRLIPCIAEVSTDGRVRLLPQR